MEVEHEQRFIIDRVGEETDLEECSFCFDSSCFSCISDHCTALKKLSDGGCMFYKDHEEDHKEIWKCFYRLIRCQRFDLLMKYADTLAALGLMDHEISMAEAEHERLEKHRVDYLPAFLQICCNLTGFVLQFMHHIAVPWIALVHKLLDRR